MKSYYWSFVIAILVHLSFNVHAGTESLSKNDRPIRQAAYRGNQKFQVPDYLRYNLSPDAYAKTYYSNDHRGADGSFGYEYETENGIKAKQESTGYGLNKVVRGYYSYIGPDGKQYTTNYIADRFGYRAYGEHLPTQPNYIYDQSQYPITPSHFPSASSRPGPTSLYDQQHHTQTAFVPSETLQSQNIYVADNLQSDYVNITPKPYGSQLPVNILPPNYAAPSSYNQLAWTTPRPYVSFA
ncbi:uncharacterized protein [Chironomus tepperi]|uniref:uncharacterized protein n=1 Tax=Chironomus tepperi TaxID=113505 RepID=UPI00391FA749